MSFAIMLFNMEIGVARESHPTMITVILMRCHNDIRLCAVHRLDTLCFIICRSARLCLIPSAGEGVENVMARTGYGLFSGQFIGNGTAVLL